MHTFPSFSPRFTTLNNVPVAAYIPVKRPTAKGSLKQLRARAQHFLPKGMNASHGTGMIISGELNAALTDESQFSAAFSRVRQPPLAPQQCQVLGCPTSIQRVRLRLKRRSPKSGLPPRH